MHGISATTTLSWNTTAADVTFDVLLDTVNPPIQTVATGLTTTSFAPASLTPGSVYYWQVVTHGDLGSTPGPVWMFEVVGVPAAPADPQPAVGQGDVAVDGTLSWNGGTGTPGVTFDVLLDTADPPVAVAATGISAATLTPPTLQGGTTYYWQVIARTEAGTTPGPVWSFRTHLIGDANSDGYVNVGDLQALLTAWNTNDGGLFWNWDPACDLNNDGSVNVGDLQILAANWAKSLQ